MAAADGLSEAADLKEVGNDLFRKGQFAQAIEVYTQAVALLGETPDAAVSGGPALELRCALLSNRAAAQLQTGGAQAALEDCSQCLALDPGHLKARYRRAMAAKHLQQVPLMVEDARWVLRREPSNKAVQALLRVKEWLPRGVRVAESPSGEQVDSNLLVLLHGVGDSEQGLFALGKGMQLPQTRILSLRAPLKLPLEGLGYWWFPCPLEDGGCRCSF